VVAVKDDRTLAGDVADGPSDPVDEDALDNGYAGEFDDGLNVDGRLLAGERQQPSRPTAGELVAYFSTF